jgi:hypothetical protein
MRRARRFFRDREGGDEDEVSGDGHLEIEKIRV